MCVNFPTQDTIPIDGLYAFQMFITDIINYLDERMEKVRITKKNIIIINNLCSHNILKG